MKFKKGSAAAKAFMAKIRSKKGKPKKAATKKKIGAIKNTFDVVFNDDNDSSNKGFEYTLLQAKNYIKKYNGTNESYFADYKNGFVEIVNNNTGKTVYSIKIKSSKIGAVKKKAAVRNYGSHKDTASHNVKISVVSGIGTIMTHFKDQYGKLAAKKLMEKTKREKNKIAKQMTVIAAKLKKLKNFLA